MYSHKRKLPLVSLKFKALLSLQNLKQKDIITFFLYWYNSSRQVININNKRINRFLATYKQSCLSLEQKKMLLDLFYFYFFCEQKMRIE